MDFHKLPNGTLINLHHVMKLRDIAGNGFYRIYMTDGTYEEVDDKEAEKIADRILPPPAEPAAHEVPNGEALKQTPKKRGRPPGSKNKSAATKT